MPTYEFRCPDGTIIERMFRISEVPEQIPVPDGDGMATRIISGGASLLFKGSGFYITDYGKDGKKDQRTAAGGEGKSSESSSGSASPSESKAGGESKSTGDSKPKGESKSTGDSKPKGDSTPAGNSKSGSTTPAAKSE